MMIALCYHDVVSGRLDDSGMTGPGSASYKLSVAQFDEHLTAIASVGPSHDLAGVRYPGLPPSPVFTFDDGGVSAIDEIAPRLTRRGLIGIFFIVTSLLDSKGFLTSKNVRELAESGHIIGSHSHTHPRKISALPDDDLLVEWLRSKRILEDITGFQVSMASVPGGFYSQRVAKAAARAGLRTLFTSEPTTKMWRVDNLEVFGRYHVQDTTSAANVADIVVGRRTARLQQELSWEARKIAKSVGGEAWFRFRAMIRPN